MTFFSRFLAFVIALAVNRGSALRGDDYPTRDQIIERVSQQIDSIESLQVKWHIVEKEDPARSGKPNDNLWAFQGSSYRYSGSMESLFRGPFWRSDDGNDNFSIAYGRHAPGVLEVYKRPSNPIAHEHDFGLAVIGAALPGTKENLSSLMKKHPPAFTSTEEIDGQPVHRLDFGDINDVWKCPHTLTVWIDAKVMLPRKILLMPFPLNGKPHRLDFARGEQTMNENISQFVRVTDSRTGREVWFPKRVEFPSLSYMFDEVILNDRIPPSFFIPRMPSGTVLYTHTAAGRTETIVP
ncbi:hypothetical protein AYO47_00095 [Planctomyces sp. SCGC AG-212-M04]|nr:hypothetical protein AYO47_00095 [Planctomyces sp. SCGC AG-212-M04]